MAPRDDTYDFMKFLTQTGGGVYPTLFPARPYNRKIYQSTGLNFGNQISDDC
jgi:hypothetical protein